MCGKLPKEICEIWLAMQAETKIQMRAHLIYTVFDIFQNNLGLLRLTKILRSLTRQNYSNKYLVDIYSMSF
jgi:hypothetical protein